jgi:hypothetical protein
MRVSIRLTAVVAVIALATIAVYQVRRPRQEQVTMFDPARIIVIRTPGGMLEAATLTKVEEFGWSARYRCPLIDCPSLLSKTVSKVRVPVHYVYRVPLAEAWELVPKGDHYELTVPGVQAQAPVAFDTSKLKIDTTRGWLTPPSRSNEQTLIRELGAELGRRSGQEGYLALAQPHASKTVEEFARRWMKEQKLSSDKPIEVRFRSSP